MYFHADVRMWVLVASAESEVVHLAAPVEASVADKHHKESAEAQSDAPEIVPLEFPEAEMFAGPPLEEYAELVAVPSVKPAVATFAGQLVVTFVHHMAAALSVVAAPMVAPFVSHLEAYLAQNEHGAAGKPPSETLAALLAAFELAVAEQLEQPEHPEPVLAVEITDSCTAVDTVTFEQFGHAASSAVELIEM